MRGSLSNEEIESAEVLGVALASNPDDGSDDVESRLGELSPQGESYARLRATVAKQELDKAIDLALGIPLTEYGDLKRALKEGIPPAHILDQLPLAWRMIRTINDPRPRRRTFGQAVRPTRIRLTVHKESGLKKDDEAELDEHWVISDKLDMFLPFTSIDPVYQTIEEGKPLVLKDRRMVYAGSYPPGAESRYWTRGGYVDRMLERVASGEHPAQLRREARRKRVRLTVQFGGLTFLVASVVFRLAIELS